MRWADAKHINQIPIIHRFSSFSALPSLVTVGCHPRPGRHVCMGAGGRGPGGRAGTLPPLPLAHFGQSFADCSRVHAGFLTATGFFAGAAAGFLSLSKTAGRPLFLAGCLAAAGLAAAGCLAAAGAAAAAFSKAATARAGNRRFWCLSALRAHTKAPYKTDLHRKTLMALNHPRRPGQRERVLPDTVVAPGAAPSHGRVFH